jgi:hypothetical protein
MSETNDEGLGPSRCSSIKPVKDLTEEERFTIAFNAGVPTKEMVKTADGFKMILFPAAISIIGNQYVVAWRR